MDGGRDDGVDEAGEVVGRVPLASVVRCECADDIPVAQAVALPRFASEPHKDGRAPQNLYPIAGLERELRHRMGDQGVLYRHLRKAAAVSG